jgi:hypothetical protein
VNETEKQLVKLTMSSAYGKFKPTFTYQDALDCALIAQQNATRCFNEARKLRDPERFLARTRRIALWLDISDRYVTMARQLRKRDYFDSILSKGAL